MWDAPNKPTVAPQAAPVKPETVKPKTEKTPQQDVMTFLKGLSREIKNEHPALPVSIHEKIDAFIRDHGNRHPETTKA